MYKKSRFNYWCLKNQNLYLYNSYTGLDSILKIEEGLLQKEVKEFLEGTTDKLSESVQLLLQKKGFLVETDIDELERVHGDRTAAVNSDRLVLTVLPTSGCNFKCVYCYEDFQPKKMNAETQEQLVKFAERLLEGKKSLFVNWFGGEPLLAEDVVESLSKSLIELCRKKKVTYFAGMTTNGYLLNLDTFRRMLRCRVIDYQITVDGLKSDHDRLRMLKDNRGSYDVIMQNLSQISKEMRRGIFNISIRCNCLKSSMMAYEEIAKQYLVMFGHEKRFSFTVHGVKDWGGESVNALRNELMSEAEEQQLLKKALSYRGENNAGEPSIIRMDTHRAMLDKHSNSCHAIGKNNYVIGTDGSIYKCTSDFEKALGNVGNPGEIENWFDFETDYVPDEECDKCFFYGACGRKICPKALKTGQKMCPLEKECIDELLESIESHFFVKMEVPAVYEYKEEAT